MPEINTVPVEEYDRLRQAISDAILFLRIGGPLTTSDRDELLRILTMREQESA